MIDEIEPFEVDGASTSSINNPGASSSSANIDNPGASSSSTNNTLDGASSSSANNANNPDGASSSSANAINPDGASSSSDNPLYSPYVSPILEPIEDPPSAIYPFAPREETILEEIQETEEEKRQREEEERREREEEEKIREEERKRKEEKKKRKEEKKKRKEEKKRKRKEEEKKKQEEYERIMKELEESKRLLMQNQKEQEEKRRKEQEERLKREEEERLKREEEERLKREEEQRRKEEEEKRRKEEEEQRRKEEEERKKRPVALKGPKTSFASDSPPSHPLYAAKRNPWGRKTPPQIQRSSSSSSSSSSEDEEPKKDSSSSSSCSSDVEEVSNPSSIQKDDEELAAMMREIIDKDKRFELVQRALRENREMKLELQLIKERLDERHAQACIEGDQELLQSNKQLKKKVIKMKDPEEVRALAQELIPDSKDYATLLRLPGSYPAILLKVLATLCKIRRLERQLEAFESSPGTKQHHPSKKKIPTSLRICFSLVQEEGVQRRRTFNPSSTRCFHPSIEVLPSKKQSMDG